MSVEVRGIEMERGRENTCFPVEEGSERKRVSENRGVSKRFYFPTSTR